MSRERAIRVFVIDDDASVCSIVALLLTDAGFAVATATSITAALAAIAVARPNIVLTDLQMPGSSDASVVKFVRARFPTLPIIAMSGNHSLAAQALALGADDFLPKPVRGAVLTERIQGLARQDG